MTVREIWEAITGYDWHVWYLEEQRLSGYTETWESE